MLEGFLIFILTLAAFFLWIAFVCDIGAGLIASIPAGLLAATLSTIPVKESHRYSDAASIRLGNEIFVQSQGLKTMIVNDMKFIDRPLVIKKTISENVYGCTPQIDYFIKQSVEVKQTAELIK